MNQLDLTRLNYRSPYQVWEGERGYCFKTDHGIFYTVEFDPEESGIDIAKVMDSMLSTSVGEDERKRENANINARRIADVLIYTDREYDIDALKEKYGKIDESWVR